MMILILINIIFQQNSPQNSDFILKSNKPLATIKLERKRNSDYNNPFPPP